MDTATIDALITRALHEDIGTGDVTTLATVPASAMLSGRFIAKAGGVVAGLAVAARVFTRLDPGAVLVPQFSDGSAVAPGDVIATVSGPGRAILSGERVALNLLQRMSGIATTTRRYVDAVAGSGAVVLDTRKTVPGLRAFDKLAVTLGGGQNHRAGLYDMALIKENHIAACGGSLAEAVQRVREAEGDDFPVEIEVTSLDELRTALALPVDRIMLDNMSLADMRAAVALTAGKLPLEASGGVSLDTIGEIAATGVNFISVGALTHSVTALDISLLID